MIEDHTNADGRVSSSAVGAARKRTAIRIALAVPVVLALCLAGTIIAFWAPDVPVDSLKARWAPPPSAFISVEGMQVHIRDEGPREDSVPIVLLHGTSASLHTWDGWVAILTKQHRVIRFDLPGFGLTGPAPDGDYSLERYARFVTATLDSLKVKGIVLVGNSLGGQIAWVTALTYPERVARLILVDAAGYPFQSASVPIGFRLARLPGISRLMENILPRAMIESSVRNVYGNPAAVTPELVERYYDLTRREGNRRALAQRFQQTKAGHLADRIPTLSLPVLILWGEQDRLIPLESGQRFNRDIQGSQLTVFPGLGHVPQEESPAQTAEVAARFITGAP